ncbi:MAG: hypothetical protein ACI9MS_001444 [Glaciecola sp.]|jgi:hypothetical protein
MNFKINLLSVAVAASLLTACGGDSSSSSEPDAAPDSIVDAAPVEVLVEPLPYSFSETELLVLGKGFVAGLDAQTVQLSSGLGNLAGGLLGSMIEFNQGPIRLAGFEGLENPMFLEGPSGLKGSLYDFMQAVFLMSEVAGSLRDIVDEMGSSGEYPVQLDTPNVFFEDGIVGRYEYSVNSEGDLTMSIIGQINNSAFTASNIDAVLTLVDTSETEKTLVISGSFANTFEDVEISVGRAEFSNVESETGSDVTAVITNISAVLDGVVATASASMSLVSGSENAIAGTARQLPVVGLLADLAANFSDTSSRMLNIASIELSDVRLEVETGEYISADSILFEDADAADYMVDYTDGSGEVANYEFNEEGNSLVLSNQFGSTIYTYTLLEENEAVFAKSSTVISAEFELIPADITPYQISCVSVDENFLIRSPRIDISCDENGENSYYNSLAEAVSGRSVYGIPNSFNSIVMPNQLVGGSGVLTGNVSQGMDSMLEPITFSVAAQGEFGLAGGLTVPYQLSLNHPGAYNYQAQAVIGAVPSLTANYSTLEENIVVTSTIPFTPADAAFAPTEAIVEFSYYLANPVFDYETGIATVGALTVNGTTVANVTTTGGFMRRSLLGMNASYVLTFVDNTHPASGGLFTTIECPIQVKEVQFRSIECTDDQSGIIDLAKVTEFFFEGMFGNNLPFEDDFLLPAPIILN